MFRKKLKEEGILLILIILLAFSALFLIFKDNFNSKNSIQINNKTLRSDLKEDNFKEVSKRELKDIFIHLGGEVKNPGVYKCKEGDRIYKVLEKAGGVTESADLDEVNLALYLRDGTKIIIPRIKSSNTRELSTLKLESSKVNINMASQEELESIKGVGPATAAKIIAYRKKVGSFKKLEDLMQVSGIGSKTFAKIKEQIAY